MDLTTSVAPNLLSLRIIFQYECRQIFNHELSFRLLLYRRLYCEELTVLTCDMTEHVRERHICS